MKQKILQISVLSSSIGLAVLFIFLSTGACKINFMGNKIQLAPDSQTVQDTTLKHIVLIDKVDGEVIYKDTLTKKYYTNIARKRKQNLPSSKVLIVFDEIIINDTVFYERDAYLEKRINFDELAYFGYDTIKTELITEYLPDGEIIKRNPKTGAIYSNRQEKNKNANWASSKSIVLFETVIINDTIYYRRK